MKTRTKQRYEVKPYSNQRTQTVKTWRKDQRASKFDLLGGRMYFDYLKWGRFPVP